MPLMDGRYIWIKKKIIQILVKLRENLVSIHHDPCIHVTDESRTDTNLAWKKKYLTENASEI